MQSPGRSGQRPLRMHVEQLPRGLDLQSDLRFRIRSGFEDHDDVHRVPNRFRLERAFRRVQERYYKKLLTAVFDVGPHLEALNEFSLWHIETRGISTFLFLKKWANPGLFFVYFWSFQTNTITIFTTNTCEKMSIQYMVLEFEPTTFRMRVSSHNP